jgi:hypothetical protein
LIRKDTPLGRDVARFGHLDLCTQAEGASVLRSDTPKQTTRKHRRETLPGYPCHLVDLTPEQGPVS